MINVKNVSFKYPESKTTVINDISFQVDRGEIFGFLGPSGAGKSTMQKLLTGILKDYQGSIIVNNIEVKMSGSDYYNQIGVDFEFPNFYNKFSAYDNLKFFSSLYDTEIAEESIIMYAKKLGLQNDLHKKVGEFSKGMKMRLSFIRSLIHHPQILFLDEPTSGLDPTNSRIIKELILEQKKLGKTIIITTHNMHDAEELCDRIAFFVDGSIKEIGCPEDFKKSTNDTIVDYTYVEGKKTLDSSCLLSQLVNSRSFLQALETNTLLKIHTKETTLEDAFISITGRSLL